ncbi:hypothetical protein [Glutamicibacter ardleyensis]|uniref:hypothetical protein n=1 Tax=Glutamicibacter ardleyensis TaxID=225894 RepID=UPI003FD416A3
MHHTSFEEGTVLDSETPHPDFRPEAALRRDRAAQTPPASLFLGVIIWSDDTEQDPTVIADRNPVTLARTMAVMIHEMIDDSPAYAGAPEFLQSNPPPQDWRRLEDVDAWLEALREATPYPAYSFHQVPTTGGADGTNQTLVNRYLGTEFREREHALSADAPHVPRHEQSGPSHSL